MNYHNLSKDDLIKELEKLRTDFNDLKESFDATIAEVEMSAEALKESREHYRLLTESIKDVVWVLDAATLRFRYISPSVERLRGFKPEEIMANPLTFSLTSEFAEPASEKIRQRLADHVAGKNSDTFYTDEVQQPCKDGSTMWAEVITNYYTNPDNGRVEVRGVTRDITERKRNEQIRLEAESKFSAIFHSSPIASVIYSMDGKIVEVNAAYTQLSGFSREELMGKTTEELNLIKPEERQKMIESIKASGGSLDNFEVAMTKRDGSQCTLLVSSKIAPINGILHRIGINVDISDRKKLESDLIEHRELLKSQNEEYLSLNEELKESNNEYAALNEEYLAINEELQEKNDEYASLNEEYIVQNNELLNAKKEVELSEERWKFALEGSKDGVWDWNIKTDEVFFSAQWKAMLGYADHELSSHLDEWSKRVHPEDMQNCLSAIQQHLDGKANHYSNIHRMMCKDGSYKWILDRGKITQTDTDGKPLRMIGTHTDLTDRIEMEQELIVAKEKAEESNRLKTAFLQNMSHEIRTPMNAIVGFSKMLERTDLSPEKRSNFISIIVNSSNQLLAIVSDILTISSVETKQETLSIEEVCLNDIVAELLAIFKAQAANNNISLHVKQQLNNDQSKVLTDRTKITQVLSNLIGNAIKFTHQGQVEFGYTLKGNDIEFFVKDSGIGISNDKQEMIFERFRQANEQISKRYGGTGLGLAISKAFVELMGGKIWVESTLEKGSAFYFTIPYTHTQPTKTKDADIQNNTQNPTLLIAEDEEYNYLLLEELLSSFQVDIVHAKNGLETVQLCKSNPNIVLVLMDIKMPIMDGHTAAKQIKEFRPDIPIIAQSAYALDQEIEGFSGPFIDYVTKPIDGFHLVKTIKSVLRLL